MYHIYHIASKILWATNRGVNLKWHKLFHIQLYYCTCTEYYTALGLINVTLLKSGRVKQAYKLLAHKIVPDVRWQDGIPTNAILLTGH